ncbi:hypothetical protein COCMIDRAFT_88293 [Bipolaris oryzae ATCC 44560]|uniref:DUF221-domain-containing protein n=1 Tax=Bipolaris oryzae ATCC 44560 TaxID=930090 RepID=W6ZKR9_COCMI|nr:uncharacterized protein COCMIDRAFT_88293 [Bipolaris oryzae ATCC 44560]EUC48104.1 hypothetical protein COCMIDRAFT_88293 [Bipolaris oryzae ATCC 44560]
MIAERRQNAESSLDRFIDLISDPFQSQVQETSIYAAVVYSFVVSGLLVLTFCFLRPRNSRVYAPRAKHADEKHRPLPLGNKPLSWLSAVRNVREQDLVDKIGLDAIIFLRFMRMIRNIFFVLTVVGCLILIPVNVVGGSPFYKQWSSISTLMKFTPQYIFGRKFWAYVAFAYMIQGTVCFFLWRNYSAVLKLRRAYFDTEEYKSSLHARTLLLTHVPQSYRTDAGLVKLIEQAKPIDNAPRAVIGRNVKELPKLIEDHDQTVRDLEKHLAKYLSNPNRLPARRPTCKPAKDDQGIHGKGEVDAIDYLTERITRLETTIKEVRETVDMRNPMPYGFASYEHIEDAHAVAFTARKKGPEGCDVYLAPKPHDLLWQNLAMSRRTRTMRAFWDGLWIVIFTVAFIIPNMLTSVFLSDFSHLGLVWPTFQANLSAHPTSWAIAQGILAPLVQTLMYMGVPVVFRRLFTHSGDVSKTSRERHVTARLYSFFVFNNLLVFSVFGSTWRFVAAVIAAKDQGVWDAIRDNHLFTKIMSGLCNVSTFWLTWQMQRNLGAAIDLSQAWVLLWSWIQRKCFSPTPRELIELSAPQPFPYAEYYNNYLFVTTVGLCMGALQPVIFPVTAFYLAMDCVFKKYLLQYVFITKTESGGRFWRLLVNRTLFAVALANAVIALVVGANGIGSIDLNSLQAGTGNMLFAMVPLPFFLLGFKWYCKRSFDEKLSYFSTRPFSDAEAAHATDDRKQRKTSRLLTRFGHPALYKKLLTPMVHAKSQHLLKEVYSNRSGTGRDIFDTAQRHSMDRAMPATPGYERFGDFVMTEMDSEEPGKQTTNADIPHVEIVAESELDFENFKKRAEFRDAFGGDGELYGRPEDASRPGTPSTFTTFTEWGPYGRHRGSAPASPSSSRPSSSRTRLGDGGDFEQGTSYAKGYQRPPRPVEEGYDYEDLGDDADAMLHGVHSRQPLVGTTENRHSNDNNAPGHHGLGTAPVAAREDTSYERFRHTR